MQTVTWEKCQFKERQGWLSLAILLLSLKFAQYIFNKIDTYKVLVSLDVHKYVPETLMQKNNMGTIGNDMRIK